MVIRAEKDIHGDTQMQMKKSAFLKAAETF